MDVYKGNTLYVEYYELLKVAIAAGFTRSNGDRILNYAKNVVKFFNGSFLYFAWLFYPINPWVERFNPILHAATDTGLRLKMLDRAE